MSIRNPNSIPPPQSINVQKFAESRSGELQSLHQILSNRLNCDFKMPRSKRRRTTSYLRPQKKKTLLSGSDSKPEEKKSRRVRRRLEMQMNPEEGFVKCRDGTKRLRTHLWLAKRFEMRKLWGFYLPLGLHGRGRGSRAVLKWLKCGAVVHDASYCHPIQLEGPKDSIIEILRMVSLIPNPSIPDEMSQPIEYGVGFKNAMLYHVGAPLSQFIAPVNYMWRPVVNENCAYSELDHVSSINPAKQECSTSYRQLWIWIHAAGLEEGFVALRSACQKQNYNSGVSVSCVSLEGRVTKLEIMGSKAVQILQKALHSLPEKKNKSDHCSSKCSYLTACTSSQLHKPLLSNAVHFPSNSVLSMTVSDPRDLHREETDTDLKSTRQESDMLENDALAPWSNLEENAAFLSDSLQLWDTSEKLKPPRPENIVCKDRHQRRLKHFYLDSNNDEKLAHEATDGFGESCPILLLKHANRGNFISRWSIVLPLSWVKIFWISLLSHGAHAIGLRERKWIACDSKMPCFPYDFPDSKAYSLLMSEEAASFKSYSERRPLAMRPLNIPIPPPWHCIEYTCNNALEIKGDVTMSDKQLCESSSSDHSETLFNGFISRYSNASREYLVNNTDQIPSRSGLCLVRVLICAYKEGAFEDGAVICAPILADLPLWESRSEEMGKLQIPQSVVNSYFTQQYSGKWDLQLPDDCSNLDTYRWPIGFITTGFVRGSKKPTAVAFCEAKLLALLREQQSRVESKPRHEIRVLVRNLRSAAYRRAAAQIVLEVEKDDAEFL